jgi:hypothetical protein
MEEKAEWKDEWGPGDSKNWKKFDEVIVGKNRYDLVNGENKHSYSCSSHYAVMNGEAVPFDGHRNLFSVQLDTNNYLKESEYSGDEIRKSGSGKIIVDGEIIYEFFFREIESGLRRAEFYIAKLKDFSIDWLSKKERDKLVGRKIFYREIPSVIKHIIVDQGCIIVETQDGKDYPPPVYHDDEEDGIYDELSNEAKVEIFDTNIWWWRKG